MAGRSDRCEYLFHMTAARNEHAVPAHDHPFWQLEVVTAGVIEATIGDRVVRLETGGGILIPPEHRHAFRGPEGRCAWVSVKFLGPTVVSAAVGALELSADGPTGALCAGVVSLAGEGVLPEDRRGPLEHVLAALVDVALPKDPDPDQGLVERAQELIDSQAYRPLTVAVVADYLGCSTRHLSALFRRETGRHLKRYIDEVRLAYAQQLIRYGDDSITEIAEHLGYRDLYAFSRFFSRMAGASPSAWRQSLDRPR